MKRSGITLVEVLVAIFIMGVGLLAILTLFPVGLLNCRQALRDDRIVQAASNASSIAIARNIRHDPLVEGQFSQGNSLVYVDGFYSSLSNQLATGIPRTSITLQNKLLFPKWFSLLDDYNFDNNAVPTNALPGGSGVLELQGIYTWAYLLRRPRPLDPSTTDMAVVVYEGRNTSIVAGETLFAVVPGNIGDTSLTVPFSGAKPEIGKSGWILDLTPINNQPAGNFYRVINMTEGSAANTVVLETQIPIKNPISQILVMEKVAEVLERGTGWQP